MELRFRLPVHKMKCTYCQLIFTVENSNTKPLGFTCPNCVDYAGAHVEHMEDIVIVEELETDEKTQKVIDRLEALPKSDMYVLNGDLAEEDMQEMRRLWQKLKKEEGYKDTKLIIMPDRIHLGTTSKEDLKSHITDILERL